MFDNEELIENEWYIIRNSGEIPEIALHSSLYFLTRDKKGPQLELDEKILCELKGAAETRFMEIVSRDLEPENREKTIYRGLARSIANWNRFLSFSERQQISSEKYASQTARKLLHFLETEMAECRSGKASCINCTYDDLVTFASQLGLDEDAFPEGISEYCRE